MGFFFGICLFKVWYRLGNIYGQSKLYATIQEGYDGSFGARCIASPSNETEIGKKILQENPNSTEVLELLFLKQLKDALVIQISNMHLAQF